MGRWKAFRLHLQAHWPETYARNEGSSPTRLGKGRLLIHYVILLPEIDVAHKALPSTRVL